MRVIRHVAANVFRESVRDRVPYTLVVFSVLLIAASRLLAELTAGQDVKIIKDLGPRGNRGVRLVHRGVSSASAWYRRRSSAGASTRSCRNRSAEPQFIAGKYAGLVLTLAVNVAVMTVALYLVLAWLMGTATPAERASWDAPAVDLMLLKGICDDPRRADGRHRRCAVFFHVLEPVSVRRVHARPLCRGALQPGAEGFPIAYRFTCPSAGSGAGSIMCCLTSQLLT